MKKKTPKITAGDCVEMYDFLAGKGIRLKNATVHDTYETAMRHGYKKPSHFGKVGGGRRSNGWLLVVITFILLFLGYVWFTF